MGRHGGDGARIRVENDRPLAGADQWRADIDNYAPRDQGHVVNAQPRPIEG
jgi:hypothetical protein